MAEKLAQQAVREAEAEKGAAEGGVPGAGRRNLGLAAVLRSRSAKKKAVEEEDELGPS